jgi:uncharacterized protein YbjT (DUF2867 family)
MILITGATGNVGREAVGLLLAEGLQVVAVSRNPVAAPRFPKAARVIAGDPSRPHTLADAFDGIEAILLSPRALAGATAELVALAVSKGVRRAVLLSALTVQYGGGLQRFADEFRAIEDVVKGSGLEWTLLRSADYASNATAWIPQIQAGDMVRGADAEAKTSTVHEWDVAAVATRSLIDATHVGRTYVLTGPQSLTQHDKVRVIGQAIGRDLKWQEAPADQIRQAMLARGLPSDVPDRMLGYLADCVQRPGPTSDCVQPVLGRPALTFSEWATEHAAEFRG